MRIIAKLRHPFRRENGLNIQNGIIMPVRQDMDRFGSNHSCTMIVRHVPDETEIRDIQTFARISNRNNGFTAIKDFPEVRLKTSLAEAISANGERRLTQSKRYFIKADLPFSVGDDIYVNPKAVGRYYTMNKPDESNDTFEVFVDDIIGYKKLGAKSFSETGNYVMGYPYDDQTKIAGVGLIGISVSDYRQPVKGLFRSLDGTIYKGYGEKYPSLNIVGREGDVKNCFWYPKTSFYATFRRVRGKPEFTPLPGRIFIAFEQEETKLILQSRKPLLTGAVVAPDSHKHFGKRVVYDLFMFPFEYENMNCVAVFEENIRMFVSS